MYEDIKSGKIKPFGTFGKLAIYGTEYTKKGVAVMISGFLDGEKVTDVRKTTIFCNASGERNYIIRRGKRFYLDMYS